MKERPILFNAEMVKAILDGRKTQTRRVLKKQPPENLTRHCWYSAPVYGFTDEPQPAENFWKINCPFGVVGDRLWVRETFRLFDSDECPHADFPCGCPSWGTPLYRASHDCGDGEKWTPSIHMPRSASRILLEITNIRVERLNQISKEDAVLEGCSSYGPFGEHKGAPHHTIKGHYQAYSNPVDAFKSIWDGVYGHKEWNKNPWVWVVEFKVIQGLNK